MDWEIKICHSYSEANRCADALTNIGCDCDNVMWLFELCHAQINQLVIVDVYGVTTSR